MAELRRIGVILLLFCVQPIWAIYVVPEHTAAASSSNQVVVDTLQMKAEMHENGKFKTYPALMQQSVNYPINSMGAMDTIATYTDTTTASHYRQSQTNAVLAKTSQRRHHTSYDKNDDVAGVNGYNNNNNNDENENIFENLEAQPSSDEQIRDDSHITQQQHSRQRRELSDWLIAPNTRWCGRGNTANGTYNHLGGASRADKCCRKHDHCKLYIPAMSNRFGLFNYLPYTLSHCNCDRRFRTCLKMANDEDANAIGKFFFNMVDTQCFILVKEHVCQIRAADGTCAQEHVKKKAYLKKNKRF